MAPRAKRRNRRARSTRPARPVLGNDPFQRGAAPREIPPPPPTGGPAAGPAPPPRLGSADYARELAEILARLLPALRERIAAASGLLRLGRPGAPLDPHGMDPSLLERAAPLLDFLYLTWWRVEASSAARLPDGPLVVVANRGGTVPWDALVLRLAAWRETRGRRDLRPLLEEAAFSRPLVGRALERLGAVPASPESMQGLLSRGGAVAVFPEGGAPRPWPQRYRLGAFGRGFVKQALRAGAALVPCAVVGSEEASPPLDRTGFLASALGLPALASAPGLPLGPLGGIPLPSRWRLHFGAPADLSGLRPESSGDAAAVDRISAQVRERLQAMLDEAVAARGSIFL